MKSEDKIRWMSLLVAITALENSGENMEITVCNGCGGVAIEGNTGTVYWDEEDERWVFEDSNGVILHA